MSRSRQHGYAKMTLKDCLAVRVDLYTVIHLHISISSKTASKMLHVLLRIFQKLIKHLNQNEITMDNPNIRPDRNVLQNLII